MGKQDVFTVLATDWTDPGSYKSGEYFLEHAYKRLKRLILSDRVGVVEALAEWLESRSVPDTLYALHLARRLDLIELVPMICAIRNEVNEGKILNKYNLVSFDKALLQLRGKDL